MSSPTDAGHDRTSAGPVFADSAGSPSPAERQESGAEARSSALDERTWARLFLAVCSLALVGLVYGWRTVGAAGAAVSGPGWDIPADDRWRAGADSLSEDELRADVEALAAPRMEGRDTPSLGLWRAGEYISERLAEAGYEAADGSPELRVPFPVTVRIPVPERCALEVLADGPGADVSAPSFAYGDDFVPVPGATGSAEGQLIFVGYGIRSREHRSFDELRGRLAGRIAVVLEGDPDHPRRFGGPELTDEAALYAKLAELERKQVAGVLFVRRESTAGDPDGGPAGPRAGELSFRHTFASWLGERLSRLSSSKIPALALDRAAASRLLGLDVDVLAAEIDRTGKPLRRKLSERRVRFESASTRTATTADNIVGALRGSDPALADEWVVLGAHYDHVGVDERGRIGLGADDNASGTAVLLEVAEALAQAQPRRSILICAFAAEEDGLLGSQAIAAAPPIRGVGAHTRDAEDAAGALIAMLNLDMVGRGEAGEVAAIGTRKNPSLKRLLSQAQALGETGIDDLVTHGGAELFERSDHYSFHRAGVPALFFFEGLPISRNADYHTWRDTVSKLNIDKMGRTARLVYNAAWLLASDDERPPSPR